MGSTVTRVREVARISPRGAAVIEREFSTFFKRKLFLLCTRDRFISRVRFLLGDTYCLASRSHGER